MANTIRIYRSASTNTPASLAQGELANSESGSPNGINEFFIGTAGPTVWKLLRNINGAPAEPTAGLANGTLDMANDYFIFEDVTDSTPYRYAISSINLSGFNDDLTYVSTVTAGTGLANSGTAADPVLDFDFSELTDMTGAISGTTEFILQDGTTESRKAASEIALSNFSNDSGWTSDLQLFHASYAFSTTITAGDPGAGVIRFNSATPASVTALYIDDLEDNGNDWGWILSNLGSNDIITIKSYVDAADYLVVQVNSGPTDNTGYWTVPVTVLFSGTLPSASDILQIDVQWFSQGTAGTVTSVTAGTGLINTGSASAVVLDLDFSELTDMTGSISTATEFILQDGTTESRKAAGEIALSYFNNDLSTIDVAIEATDTSCYVAFFTGQTGQLQPKTVGGFWFNSNTIELNCTQFVGGGAGLTALTAANISSGNLGSGVLPYVTADSTSLAYTVPFLNTTGNTSGNYSLYMDTTASFTFNPATNALHAGQLTLVAALDETYGGTGQTTYTTGDILYASAANTLSKLAAGTDTYVLTAGGAGVAPSWQPAATVSGAMTYIGGYNASTNTPDLDVSPSGISGGDTYTVTADGTFFTEAVQTGDMLVAENDDPTTLAEWTIVQANIGAASETAPGYIEIATQAEVDAASSTTLAVVPSYLHSTTFDCGTF